MIRNGAFGRQRLRAFLNYPNNINTTSSRRGLRIPAQCSPPHLSHHHYAVLGLTPLASKSDVKQAYKKLALKYHPDVYKEEDNSFKEIKSAYENLMQKLEEEEEEEEFTEVKDFDEYDEWEEWMGFEGGIPVVYNPS